MKEYCVKKIIEKFILRFNTVLEKFNSGIHDIQVSTTRKNFWSIRKRKKTKSNSLFNEIFLTNKGNEIHANP